MRIPVLATLALVLSAPPSLSAQTGPTPPDSVPPADSARIRILRAVERLSRGPVADSLIQAMADSAREAAEAEGGRRGGQRPGGAAGGPGAGGDSVAQALLRLPGYSVTHYEGAQAHFDARERRLRLLSSEERQARVMREGMELAADSAVVYDETTGRVRAQGGSRYTPDEGDPVDAEVMVFDLNSERGSALGARTTYTEGASWIMAGDLTSLSSAANYGHDIRFTSCEREDPHYHFETDRIKIVRGQVLVARPVRLYFADVPVAWLPFIAQGLGRGRSSGILPPRFSVNDVVQTSGGQQRRVSNVGFYWAMSDYMDSQLALDWFSGEFLSLTGSFRYRWLRKFLRGDLNLRRFWREEGGTEFALDTRHSWEISERTRFRGSASFTSSADFVRRNTFDPRELTQTIDSDAGLSRRFDWGNLSLSWNRRQSLSDGSVSSTLPSANLSLKTVTLFPAPLTRARWFNNLTWSGGMSFNRRLQDFEAPEDPDSTARSDMVTQSVGANHSVTMGNFNFSQSLNVREAITRDADPDRFFEGFTGGPSDFNATELDWSTSLDYQQRIIGSTTITPRLSVSGRSTRTDAVESASERFVTAPIRMNFGARLKTDMYRFFPGFGSFEQVRHKVSPSFEYNYAPEVTANSLQSEVFNTRDIRRTNELTVGLNQTFEAKMAEEGDTAATAGDPERPDTASGPRRREQGRIVTLLALQTSAVNYDFVQADSLGSFQAGINTTRLRNTVSSDFLRGLSMSTEHDLFAGESLEERSFDPHLSNLNLRFAFGARSGIFRWIRSFLGEEEAAPPEDDPGVEEEDPFAPASGSDESRVIPGVSRDPLGGGRGRGAVVRPGGRGGASRGWNANVSYSLRRPRGDGGESSQMIQGTLGFSPTESWDVDWRTSFDVESGTFNDHIVSLTRDLHRWQATFDFRQTAAGNWTFRFEVALTDNRDLKFDYRQQNIESESSRRSRRF